MQAFVVNYLLFILVVFDLFLSLDALWSPNFHEAHVDTKLIGKFANHFLLAKSTERRSPELRIMAKHYPASSKRYFLSLLGVGSDEVVCIASFALTAIRMYSTILVENNQNTQSDLFVRALDGQRVAKYTKVPYWRVQALNCWNTLFYCWNTVLALRKNIDCERQSPHRRHFFVLDPKKSSSDQSECTPSQEDKKSKIQYSCHRTLKPSHRPDTYYFDMVATKTG